MTKEKVLFICGHNSARSQMAEAFLRKYGGDRFEAESAGLEPTELNPLAVEAMKEVGLDISGQTPQSVFELYKKGKIFSHVITVCDQAASQCPIFPGLTQRHHWPFDDPAAFTGTWDEKLAQTRQVRDRIENTIKDWLTSVCP
jgi:arsenate reductase